MTISKVGAALTFNSAGSNITSSPGQDISMTPTAGNTIVVIVFMRGSTSTAVTVTPTGGSATFTSRIAQLGNSVNIHFLTASNIGAGITKINVAPNVSAKGQIWVQEYSGVNNSTPMDVTPVSSALSSSGTLTPPSITPVTNGALVIDAWGNQANSATASPYKATTAGPTAHSGTKAGAGWTAEYDLWNQNLGSASHNLVIGSDVCNDLGAYQADWTAAVASAATAGAIALRPATVTTDTTKFFAMM